MYVSTHFRRLAQKSRFALAFGALALYGAFAAPVLAQTQVVNNASVTVPAGVVDTNSSNNTASVTVSVVAPNLVIAKSGPATAVVGTAYNYVVTVTNNGTAPTTAIATVTDAVPAGLTINSATGCSISGQTVTCSVPANLSNVAPGNTASFTINVTPTASAAASVSNTAVVTGGGDPDCVGTGCTTPPVVTTVTAPNLVIAKSGPATAVVGTAYNYVVTVTNNGTAPTTAIATVTDAVPAGLTINSATGCSISGQTVTCSVPANLSNVAPGNTRSFTINVTPTASAAASVSNTAVVTGGGDPDCVGTGCTTPPVVTTVTAPNLVIAKSGPATAVVGTAYNYVVTVTNNGTAPTTAIATVTDAVPAGLTINSATGCSISGQTVTCSVPANLSNVAPGNTASFTINVTPTASAAASVSNTAVVTGGGDPDCVGTGCTTPPVVTTVTAPNLVIAKSGPATAVVGTAYNYVVTVTNNGTAPTTAAATITDVVPAGLTINTAVGCTTSGQTVTCPVAAGLSNVAPGNTRSFTINVTPTASAASSVSNTAVVTGGGDPDCVGTGCTTPPVVTTVRPTIDAVDDSYTVPAAGGTTASVIANDTTNNVAAVIGTNVTLTPGAAPVPAVGSITMGANGTITVAANTAAGSYSYPYQICTSPATVPVTCDSAVATVVIAAAPALTIDKSAGAPSGGTVGSTIAYSFLVTNTGNTPLTGIVINDPLLTAAAACPVTALAPGASTTCTASYAITQANIDAGVVNNSATATGTPPSAPAVTSPPDTTTTPITQSSALTVAKSVTSTGPYALGSTISYSVVATNSGTVTLNNVVVSDPLLAAPNSTTCATLAPGATCTLTGSYAVQQTDVDAGQVVNTATADSNETDPVTGTTTTPITQSSALTVAKSVTSTGPYALGSTISYSVVATNSGTVTLNNVVVSDPLLAAPNSTTCATLAPGATCTLTGSYAVQQTDVDAGQVVNTATADSNETDPVTGTTTTPITQSSALTVAKSVTSTGPYALGSTISYSVVATNSGTVTLNNVVVSDPLLAAPNSTTCATLAPGATCTLTGSYAVQQTDVDAGQVVNTATADSNETDPVTGTTTTPITQSSALTVAKSVTSTGPYALGSTISYSVVATNSGTVTLNNVVVSDPLLAAPNSTTCATLAPGATCTLTGSYAVQQTDVDAGQVVNTATADSNETDPVTGTTTTPITQSSALTVAKSVTSTGPYALGSTISYSVVATNSGTVTLNNVVVSDPLLAAPNSTTCATLAPGATCTLTGSYAVQQTDVDAGQVVNTATADSNETDPVTGTTTTPITQSSALTVAKSVTSTGPYALGSTISYSVVATNSGTVTLNNVVVSDPLLAAPNSTTCATLAPGATCTLTGSYAVQQTDVDAGQVVNTATADSNETDPVTGTTTTPITQSSALTVAKSVTSTGPYALGSTISYSVVATNSGTVTLNNVVVSDPLLAAPNSTTCATLAPGATCTLTGSYAVQQTDVDAGQVVNTATADSNETDPVTGTTTTPITQSSALTVAKSVTSTGPYALGSTISYSVVATNSGTVTLNNVVVSDPLLAAPNSTTCATLAPGATCTLTGSYAVQQTDVDAGQVVNTATADSNETDPVTGTTTTPITQSSALTVAKSVTSTGPYALGSTISYSVVATNSGTVTLNNVVVSDPLLAAPNSTTCATLAPGATCTLTGSYAVQQTDVDAGQVVNTATADSNETDPVTGTTTTPITQSSALTVAKSVTSTGPYALGSTISYSVVATNSGTVTLNNVVVSDPLLAAPNSTTCATLAPGATCTLTGSYAVQQTDVDAGQVVNTATADSNETDPVTGTTTTPITQSSALTVAKSVTSTGPYALGSTISYSVVATNSGTVTLNNVVVSDPLLAAPNSTTCATLAPGATCTLTGSYAVQQTDVDAGQVVNTATADSNETDPVTGTTTTPITQSSALTVAKSVTSTGPYALGSTISYSVVATNSGTVTLNNVVVSDPLLAAPNSTTCATLAPGATCTLTGSYAVQQTDVDAGQVVNTATADSNETDPVTGTTTTPITQSSALTVAKSVTSTGPYALGSTISYSVVATNSGTVTLNNVVVSDPLLAAPNSTTCATLAPGATCTLTGSYAVQQTDVDAGQVVNTATADSNETDPVTGTTTTPITQSSALTVAKSVTSTGPYALGSTISYSVVATNSGTVTLNNVVVSDPLLAAPNSTTCATLAPGATCTLTGSYAVQQTDVDAGQVVNTATADSNETDPVTGTTTTPITQSSALTVAKSVTSTGPYALGSTISYSVVATNSGTVTLNNVVVSDPLLAAPNSTTCATLAPGATCTLTGSYAVQQTDVDAGQVVNTATADSNETDPVTGTTTTPITQSSALTVAKSVTSTGPYALGSTISYSVVATNSGTVTLNNVVVSDPLLAAPNSTTCATLAPGATCTLTGSYAVQQTDVDAGQVVNTATADSNETDPVTGTTTTPITQSSALTVAKSVTSTGPYALGSTISYSVVATNSGTVTLNNVVVSDPLLAAPNSTTCATLAPGATCTLTGSYAVQQTDVDAGQVVNTATADSNETDPVTGTTTTPITQSSALTVAKSVTSTGPYALGSTISYSVVATNSGTVTLNNVVVSDPLLAAPNSTTCATLAPGATCTLTGSYAVQQTDVDAGQVVNTATADSNETDPVTGTTTTPITQSSALTVAKSVTSTGPYALGSTISYSVVATNSGTVTLNNVVVSDPLLAAPNSTTCATLAPGATCTLTGSYAVQQTDVDAGQVVNTATADSNETDPVTGTTTTPITQSSALTVAKSVTSTGPYALGSTISYSVVATNSGTVTLNNVVVSDPLLAAPNSTTCATLAPGATCTLTGSYAVQQTDVDAGQVVNTATADSNETDPVTGTTTTPITQSSALTVAKSVTSTGPYALGSTISYSVVATNSGTVTLNNVVVSDPLLAAPNSTTCATLAPGATCTLTGSYAVQQTDVDAGQVVNTATADSNETDPVTGTTTTPITQSSALTVAKSVTSTGPYALGSTISYSVVATNSGTVTLNNVVVSDPLLAAPNSTTCATLAPGATCTLTGSYAVQQTDVDAGQVVNTATADSNETDPVTGTTTTPITQSSALTVAKSVTSTGPYALGSTISYSVVATNSGTVTLNNVVVSDPLLAAPNSTTCATLAPGATCTLTGSYAVQQTDVDAGQVVNTATADSNETDPVTGTTTTPITQSSALTVAKSVTSTGPYALGSTISYSVVATNSGTVTLNNVVVSDPLLAAPNSTTCATLAPGATCTLTGSYAVQQTDVDAGQVVNTATADSNETDPVTGTTTTPITQSSALTVAKSVTSTGPYALGSTISYSVVATNSGTVTLNNVVVSDPLLAAPNSTTCATLAPGATCTLTGSYAVQQTDVDAGQVVNTATADSNETDPVTGTTTTPITQSSALTVAKSVTSTGPYALGSTISYSVVATNSGTVTLNNVVVSDPLLAAPNSTTCATLAPGATCTLTGSYAVQQTDVDAGQVVNTATADSNETDPVTGTTTTPITQTSSQTLVKALTNDSTGGAVVVGDVLTYTVTMTNTGNTTLSSVVVGDALTTPSTVTCASVAPGASCELVGTYTVTQADADAGTIRNTAVVTSPACPAGSTDPGCTTTIDTPVQNPAVTFSKSVILPIGQTEVSVGDTLTYNLQVVVGDAATTSPVTLTDTLGQGLTLGAVTAGSLSCGTGNPLVCTLPANTVPGTYLVTYTAIVNELATGFVRNVVVATGDDAPTCQGACQTETIVTEPLPAIVSYGKSAVLPAGKTSVVAGDVITYTLSATVAAAPTSSAITLTDTLGTGLTFGTVTSAGAYTCSATSPLVCTLPEGTVPGVYTVTYTATVNDQASGVVRNAVVGTGTDNPVCANECDIETPVATPTVVVNKGSDPANGATVQPGQVITYTLSVQVGQAALDSAVTLVDTPDRGLTLGAMPAGCAYNGTTITCIVPAGTPVGTQTFTYTATVNASVTGRVTNVVVASGADPTDPPPTCQTCSTEHLVGLPEIRLSKSAGVREVRIGDLVRYTLTVENVGSTDLVNGSITDTPAAGFSYVEGSLLAADADQMATVSGHQPLRFAGVDVRAGETATLVYVLRVGAGVRPGAHINQAQVRSSIDEPVSNVATAEVQLTADAMLDDSLLFGTVFNDRDGDGWQDSATLGGVKVQGGFAPGAYIANSTTLDHGAGPQPEPDASSPMLHGIAVGTISGRQSPADPVDAHEVVIRQRLSELAFTDDFVLTSDQGVTVRMDAVGNTRIEQSGDAAKGLTAAAPTVERRVAQGESGYVVDYVIRNAGIDERGIPGVRIASVEGLLIETDQYGRYHLAGMSGGAWERGRNFILKVDPSTLPSGAEFTTDNPLLRRITPGVPVRFDFGVKLPEQVIEGGSEQVELELGEVFFAPGSAEVRVQYQPVIEAMAAQVRKHGGGEVVISANGDAEPLAFERANAVKAALLEMLEPTVAQALVVSVRGNVDDPGSLVVGVDEGGALLGTVLFDTDKAAIRPEFEPLLDKVAAALEKRGGGSIAIVGHTDVRGSHAYNTALGMRRAKAVYEALAKRLSPEVRANVRVESSNDPTAPVGVRK